jgi:RES domain-containing protein
MQLTQTRLVGLAFRATSPRYADLHKTAAMSRLYPGRFNSADVGAVYASREPETAIEELRRRAARDGVSLADMHPRSILVIDLSLHEIIDLTAPRQLDSWGLTSPDLVSDDMERCQEVAGIVARLGAEAIRWPYATGSGQSLAVFVDQLRPGSHAEVSKSFDLTREMLGAVATGASVTTLIPALGDISTAGIALAWTDALPGAGQQHNVGAMILGELPQGVRSPNAIIRYDLRGIELTLMPLKRRCVRS